MFFNDYFYFGNFIFIFMYTFISLEWFSGSSTKKAFEKTILVSPWDFQSEEKGIKECLKR